MESSNVYDWLGRGAYFFEESESMARRFPRIPKGEEVVVIKAEISLNGCLDLATHYWDETLRQMHRYLLTTVYQQGGEPPNQKAGRNELDRAVIELMVKRLEQIGYRVSSVRHLFPEGHPIYAGSAFLDKIHSQIAVRDPSMITSFHEVATSSNV